MSDDELTGMSAAASRGPNASSSPGDAKHTASSRGVPRESSASAEDVDTIEDVDSDSDGEHPWGHSITLKTAGACCIPDVCKELAVTTWL